jgi:CMP-N,N'-diacetyllegionaminic acid synthase
MVIKMNICKKVVAIVPAKGTSLRVKNKNMQKIGDLTLIERKIKQLMDSKLIDEVYVGSDSVEILEIASRMGAKPLLRDAYVCDEARASANEMIADLVSRVDADVILWAHCTNPFVDATIYDEALETYFENSSKNDSVVSVTRIQNHFWYRGRPLNFNPKSERHPLASTLEPLYYQNGAIFIQSKSSFVANSYFYGNSPFLFEVSEIFSYDINTEGELELARLLESHLKI